MSEPKQSNQLFKGVMLFMVPERMKIDNASLNIVYDIETGREHESIMPILLDYDPLERIIELEAAMQEFADDYNESNIIHKHKPFTYAEHFKQILSK